MEFMLDSANLTEIEQVKRLGLLEGLTTNPLIIKRAMKETAYKKDFLEYAKRILDLTEGKPTFFQVGRAYTKKEIVEQAKRIYGTLKPFGNVHVKVPIDVTVEEKNSGYDAFEAIDELVNQEIPILATAIVTPIQAFLAARAGANYAVIMLRPYDNIVAEELGLGDLKQQDYLTNPRVLSIIQEHKKTFDSYLSGLDILDRTSKIFKSQNLETRLIVAGIRNSLQLSEVLERDTPGAVTIPFFVFKSLFSHEGSKRFVRDTYNACNSDTAYGRFLKNGK